MSNFNCGIIGGKPKEAFYLVGVQEDSLIFLDPHATQSTIGLDERSLRMNHNNFHEGSAKKMPFNKLDPTLTFAFYLRTTDEFEQFKKWLTQMQRNFGEYWLFSSQNSKPNFMKSRPTNVTTPRNPEEESKSTQNFET